ncbi:MAG: alcohol dehydrogenase catalytic domain-containing protein [Anaerolineales bacterium]|nr:alcohol dehydrogenase catalytic domain-containing protein [Anaerolineales bacterium]
MKTARIHGVGEVRLHTEPVPLPAPGEELLRITAVGLCGSDLHWYSEGTIGDARLTRPLVLGHEFAGLTAAGRLVAVDPSIPCHRCEYCEAGHPNLCASQRFAGHDQTDGGLCQQFCWPSRYLFPLPPAFNALDGAMLEPLGVALHAVDLGHLRPGMRVGVFGCGPIGLLVLQVARAAGAADLLVTEPLPHRRAVAEQFGGVPWEGQPVDVAFECAGFPGAIDDAFNAARPGGKVILVGIPADDRTAFNASSARRKGLTIKLARRMKHTYPRAIRLVEQGLVNVRGLVTHRYPLEDITTAFSVAQRREGLKVVVEPT